MDTNMDEYEYGHSSSGSSAPASSQPSLLQFALFVLLLTLLILFLFLQRHPTFRFFAKALSYYVWVSILSVAMLPICALRGPTLENLRFVRSVVSHLQWLYGVEVKVEGREYLLNPEPCVIVANHQSALDFIGLMEVMPPHCAPVAKRQLAWAGPFGLMAILCKVVFIDRAHSQAAKLKLAQLVIQMHKEKLKIWIYPEGTRHGGRTMLDFKRGAFHLAVQAQVPIIPIIFSSYREFYCVSERRFHQGTVRVKILPPWETLGKEAEDVPHLTDSIREAMVETFQGLSGLTMKEETLSEGLRQRQTERITE